jgi:hypothetical protein
MNARAYLVGLVIALSIATVGDAFACGDKFLVTGRGTRYQRPKTARAATVLIYADPSTPVAPALRSKRLTSALKHEGHRSTTVESFDQLASMLAGGRFDVILTAGSVSPRVEQLLGGVTDPAVIVAVDMQPKGRSLLETIDKAVEQRDKTLKKFLATS